MGVDASGNVYVCGSTYKTSDADALVVKYNSSGTQQWATPYSGSANGADSWSDIAVMGGGGTIAFYVGGYAKRTSTNFDYSLAAYKSDGTLANGAGSWSTADPVFYDGAGTSEYSGTDRGYAIEYASTTGRVYISGMATENVPANNNINITTVGYSASDGSKVWGEATYDYAVDAIVDKDEMSWKYGLVVNYNNQYCVDDIYVEGNSIVASQSNNYITLKYSCGTCVDCMGPVGGRLIKSDEQQESAAAGLYPNPFSTNAVLRLNSEMQINNAVLSVYDVSGRLVSSVNNITATTIVIDRGNLRSGLYYYMLSDNGNILSNGKFVIAD